jgi:hypothetical protein
MRRLCRLVSLRIANLPPPFERALFRSGGRLCRGEALDRRGDLVFVHILSLSPRASRATDFRRPFQRRALSASSGRFELSINDTPGRRRVFGSFTLAEVETTYSVSAVNGSGKRAGELILSGKGQTAP